MDPKHAGSGPELQALRNQLQEKERHIEQLEVSSAVVSTLSCRIFTREEDRVQDKNLRCHSTPPYSTAHWRRKCNLSRVDEPNSICAHLFFRRRRDHWI